ncbi:LIC_13387 family protein [Streptomyces sp. NBC_00690]|uniref:LIC_13387 family protein n=1 Tax=Streptomyces sp. NBC_00690 TaxID=2975808 RepID=UPI002E2DC919|nr:hypothetical protein [Streptomyces sp. NBC_00690]
MNPTDTSRPLPRADSARPFTIGAYGFVLLGIAHLALSAASALTKAPRQREVDTAMREPAFTLLGLERTVLDLFNGFSIAMALFVTACGLLLLTAVHHAPTLIQHRTAFGRLALTVSLAALAISVPLLPPPPIVILTITSCAFALSLRRAAPAA